LLSDVGAAAITNVDNCNADLAPGPVQNRNITSANFNNYAQLAYGLATGNLVNFNELLTKLTSPVINGWRFPNKNLFSARTAIPTVNVDGLTVPTQLGDIDIWTHPDLIADTSGSFAYQIINYALLPNSPIQYPVDDTCVYPGQNLSFP
jgi:hypothetical protein